MPSIEEAIQAIRMGDPATGRQILEELLEEDENNEEVWLWLSTVVDEDEDREICLENVLALNPDNMVAHKGLQAVRNGMFNANTILSEILNIKEEPLETTFLDEFALNTEEEEELEYPSTMRSYVEEEPVRRRITPRLIILILLLGVITLLLAGAVVLNLFFGGIPGIGGDTVTPQTQQAPAGGEENVPLPTATYTPSPTPTPTPTPLLLPTPEPTEPPTPTATLVVPPTPAP